MKRFNTTGLCIPNKHFMIDTVNKFDKTIKLIEYGEYFIINRPRQYGKTTTMYLLKERLGDDYFVIKTSFEGVGDLVFSTEEKFAKLILELMADSIERKYPELADFLIKKSKNVVKFKEAGKVITEFIDKTEQKVILFIDEVDKSSNNQLFLSFIGMLRDKYLLANEGLDSSFHSVVLAGVHDVAPKSPKGDLLKTPPLGGWGANPWNIAADYKVDLTFNALEISTMLIDYQNAKNVKMDITEISELLYFYTSGHPFLVSKICQIIDEEFENQTEWLENDIIEAIKVLVSYGSINFDSITKNIEDDDSLKQLMIDVLINSQVYSFSPNVPIINKAITHGIIKEKNNKIIIHNKIYEIFFYDYITTEMEIKKNFDIVQSTYLKPSGKLDIKIVLRKFKEALEEKYSKNDTLLHEKSFLERDLRLLFLTFLKPIINGIGFSYKEVTISEEKRLDIVIFFRDEKFILELKLWRGDKYHKDGLEQLKDYMKKEKTQNAYLLIADKRKEKKFRETVEDGIFTVWV